MPNPQRLSILAELRQAANLSQAEMARRCGLRGRRSYQTAGAWERGEYTPGENRRTAFIGYLWDDLGLRREPARFEDVWAILTVEWGWDPIDDDEWRSFTQQPRPSWQTAGAASEEKRAPFQALPRPRHFVGRNDEQQRIAEYLRSDAADPLALVGMGGVGKTTLAAQIAHDLHAGFPDGVLWGSPAQSDSAAILDSWAQAYGYDLSRLPDVASKAAVVRDLLADQRLLVVLDDVPSAAGVAPLLPGGATCRVLLTTRNLEAAHALHAQVIPLSPLHETESLALLAQTVGAARTEAEPEAARRICTLLDHLPLAVEIAGQRLRARPGRTLAGFAERLQSVQTRLAELRVSDRAVRASFETSWQALDDPLRRTFARLAVFSARPFTPEPLAFLCQLDAYEAEEHLFALAALSLIMDGGPGCYRLHPLLAEFAGEKLATRDDAGTTWGRFARYYARFAGQHAADLPSESPEWEHLETGMEAAHRLGALDLVLDYTNALALPWRRQGRFTQARRGYQLAVEAARDLERPHERARLLYEWGFAVLEQDDYDEAEGLLHQAQTGYKELDDEIGAAEAQLLRARLRVEQDDYTSAGAHLQTCWAIFSEWDESRGLARTLYWQGLVRYYQGQLDEAKTLLQQARSLQATLSEEADLIPTLRALADVAIEEKAYVEAVYYCKQALALAQTTKDQGEEAAVRYLLAVVASYDQQWDQALAHAEEALVRFQRMGDREFQALTLFHQSQIYYRLGGYSTAENLVLDSIDRMERLNRSYSLLFARVHLARIYAATERIPEARHLLDESLRFARQQKHPQVDFIQKLLAELA